MADDTPKTWWGRFLPEATTPVREPELSGSSSVPRGMRDGHKLFGGREIIRRELDLRARIQHGLYAIAQLGLPH